MIFNCAAMNHSHVMLPSRQVADSSDNNNCRHSGSVVGQRHHLKRLNLFVTAMAQSQKSQVHAVHSRRSMSLMRETSMSRCLLRGLLLSVLTGPGGTSSSGGNNSNRSRAASASGSSSNGHPLEEQIIVNLDPEKEAFKALVNNICAICMRQNITEKAGIQKIVEKYKPRWPSLSAELIEGGIITMGHARTRETVMMEEDLRNKHAEVQRLKDRLESVQHAKGIATPSEMPAPYMISDGIQEKNSQTSQKTSTLAEGSSTTRSFANNVITIDLTIDGDKKVATSNKRKLSPLQMEVSAGETEDRASKRPKKVVMSSNMPTDNASNGIQGKEKQTPQKTPASAEGSSTTNVIDDNKKAVYFYGKATGKFFRIAHREVSVKDYTEDSEDSEDSGNTDDSASKKLISIDEASDFTTQWQEYLHPKSSATTNNRKQSPSPIDVSEEDTAETVHKGKCECSHEGCTMWARQGGVCIAHGAKKYMCSHKGCRRKRHSGGLCSIHGTPRDKCSLEGCIRYAKEGRGFCGYHGFCSQEGCYLKAIKGGVCCRHGAPPRKKKRRPKSVNDPSL